MTRHERIRARLGLKAPRAHVPASAPPSLMLRNIGGEWFVVMLHGGQEIHRYTPRELRRFSNRCLEMAWLASNPGHCPAGAHE